MKLDTRLIRIWTINNLSLKSPGFSGLPLFRFLIVFFLCLFNLTLSSQTPAKVELPENDVKRIQFELASSLRYQYPDSSMSLLEVCLQDFLVEKDTLNAIYTLREQARGYGHQAYYKDSYDKLWTALLLADEAQLDKATAFLYIDLGRYYSFYKRREKALEYFGHSLRINQKLVKNNTLDEGVLADNYYAYASTYRELGEINLAKQYLDSCFLYHSTKYSDINLAYLNFEKAFLLKEAQKYDQALILFESVLPWLEENDPGYQVLVNSYMGDTYREKGNFEKSEECYKNALNASKAYNSHKDFTPLIHEKLSELYYWKGDLEAAFQSLQTVKELDELYFDSRSQNNRPLLEILDSFRNEKEAQRKLLQEQRLAQLEHEERVLFLQKTILLVSLFFLMIIGGIYLAYVRAKHRAEKKLIKKQKELEIQKANEIVELKNKELSASTLKLIAKDEFIINLKDKISKKDSNVKVQDIKRLINTASVGNDENWKEFEARFINVNKDFYRHLKEKYPKLTQGDLKLCALIKLNFSSKDMAKLMGISVESVHTTRYRLRKKLSLQREDNLTEFIADF